MDKLEELRHLILATYAQTLIKYTKGYLVENYSVLLEAIRALDDLECHPFSTAKRDIIINYHIVKLSK